MTPSLIRIKNISDELAEIECMISSHPKYKPTISLPTGVKECDDIHDIKEELKKYIDNKTDTLQVAITSDLNEIKNTIEVHVIPKVESA